MGVLLHRVPSELRAGAALIRPRRLERILDALDQRMDGLEIVVEAVRRRHNVSAILRSADAFGVHRVHLVTGSFKPSIGASRGSERWLDLQFHPTTTSCVQALRARGFRVWVADLSDSAIPPEQVPVDGPCALLFGSELAGVTPEAHAVADGVVTIPMYGFAESLNVSVAAALVLRTLGERRRTLAGAGLPEPTRTATLRKWVERELEFLAAARGRL